MNVSECKCLILAGGFGTRLRKLFPSTPKVLVPINDRPFIDYQIMRLYGQGFRRFVFLLGYKAEEVRSYLESELRDKFPDITVECSTEHEALGTAGALKLAEEKCRETFFMLNGDTYFEFDAAELLSLHEKAQALATLSAIEVEDTSRYGSLDIDQEGRLLAFREKAESSGTGRINGGVYVLEPTIFDHIPSSKAVSIEHETYPSLLASGLPVYCRPQEGAFFDIGTEESYKIFDSFAKEKLGGRLGEER